MAMILSAHSVPAQSLTSPRSMGLGATTSAVWDTRGFTANPAGLTTLRDWEFAASTYTTTTLSEGGFVFYGMTFGKRFLERSAAAFQYAPGTTLRFVVPTTLSTSPSGTPASNDREISYYEPFSLGLAQGLGAGVSAGLGGRYRRERVLDTQYEIVIRDTISYVNVSTGEDEARYWLLDASALYTMSEVVTFSLVGRNLGGRIGKSLPDDLAEFALPTDAYVELGLAARPWEALLVSLQASSQATGSCGAELGIGGGFSLRGSIYVDKQESPAVFAYGAGMGWSYEFLELDAAYLGFFNQAGRQGSTPEGTFDPSRIINLDLNPYTSDRFAISVKAIFGATRTSSAKIEGVRIAGPIYPALGPVYAYRPVGTATVTNTSSGPIEARLSFMLEQFMDAPTEARPVALMPGQTVEVPLMAIFNERLKNVEELAVKEATVSVEAAKGQSADDQSRVTVLLQGRNAWDGDVLTLRYFVTPDHPDVIRYTRDVLLAQRDSMRADNAQVRDVDNARAIINAFAGKLTYVGDPRLSADRVQYPDETLRLRSGDCDDMTVCFASLLGSMGISTAFVDVVPPSRPDSSHIFLLFDTGLDPARGPSIAENPKRYAVRKGRGGRETVWLPIETTVITRGFDEAWARGAQAYYQNVEIDLGLVRGWVRIVDVN